MQQTVEKYLSEILNVIKSMLVPYGITSYLYYPVSIQNHTIPGTSSCLTSHGW